MDPTNLAYKPLWFDSCAADTGMTLLILSAFIAALLGIAFLIANGSSSVIARGRAKGVMGLCLFWLFIGTPILALDPFPPQLVRLTVGHDQLEVRSCHRWVSDIRHYPLADVDFSSELERRGSKKIIHHLLVMRDTRNKVVIGSFELTGRTHINFPLLRQIAPFAARQYVANVAESLGRGVQLQAHEGRRYHP
jgi:hypothetical protein